MINPFFVDQILRSSSFQPYLEVLSFELLTTKPILGFKTGRVTPSPFVALEKETPWNIASGLIYALGVAS